MVRFLRGSFAKTIQSMLFFAFFYLYICFQVKPHLIYHGGGLITNFPVFFRGWTFFIETVLYPGGLVAYISGFLSQLLYCSWAGAFVLTGHAWLVCIFTACLLKKIGIANFRVLSFIPAVILLATYNVYTYHFTTTLALLGALIFSCIYVKAAKGNVLFSLLLFSLLCVVSYLTAGGAYLEFALICCIYEIFFRRRWLAGLLYGILAACTGYVLGVLILNVSMIGTYSELLPFSWKIMDFPDRRIMIEAVYALYLFLPVTAVVFGLWRILLPGKSFISSLKSIGGIKPDEDKPEVSAVPAKTDKPTLSYRFNWRICFELSFLFAITAGSVLFFCDGERKALFDTDYYLYNREWKKVLDAGRHYQDNEYINHALNRALYHVGLLPSDMFYFKQQLPSLMLSLQKEKVLVWKKIGVLYDLGDINQYESAVGNSMDIYGERPQLLKQMAVIRIAKKDFDTARVYLGKLALVPFYSDFAKAYLQKLETDPNILADEDIQHLRSLKPEDDFGTNRFSIEQTFLKLLERNPENRMAFEYLMAFYMLERDLNKFIQNISRLNDFDYPQIPCHYEEAIIIFVILHKKVPDLHGWNIREESKQRFRDYLKLAERYADNQIEGFMPLSRDFSKTYFFYHAYGVSGVVNEQVQ